MSLRALWMRLRHRRRYESELDEELAFHLDAHADDLVARGVAPGEARRRARVALGLVESHKDAVRRAHGLARLDAWLGDARHAGRSLRRSPAYAATAIAILAVSMAAYLLLMAIHDTYVANPPAMAAPGALVDLRLRDARGDLVRLTREEAAQVREGLGALVRELALSRQVSLVAESDGPSTAYGIAANPGYFALLAARPARGRGLVARDAEDPDEPAVVLGDSGWRRYARADPGIVGKTVLLGGIAHRVVGVMPPGFTGFEPFPPHFWVDGARHERWQRDADTAEGALAYEIALQLAPGAEAEMVRGRLAVLAAALPTRAAPQARIADVALLPRQSRLSASESDGLGPVMLALAGIALMVLLVACANLANLMLTRALARRQELSVRTCVGASRWRVVRILLLESMLLALGAAAGALLIAAFGADALHRYAMGMLLQMGLEVVPIQVDLGLLGHALALATVGCLAFGLPPALAATGGDLAGGARRDARLFAGRLAPGRLRSVLVAAQVAGSLLLLTVTALFMDSARRAERVALGYDAAALVDLRHEAVDEALRRRIEAVPGVLGTTAVARTPLYGRPTPIDSEIDGRAVPLAYHRVDERYFDVFGLNPRAGRTFRAEEVAHGADVVVVSAATAALLWPGQSALGRRIRQVDPDAVYGGVRELEIVGVVGDVVSGLAVSGVDANAVYLPHAFDARSSLVVRVSGRDDAALLARLSDACREATRIPCDPWRLSRVAGMVLVPLRVASRLGSAIGLLALSIAAIGLYGMVRYHVQGRTREIGLRLALGATGARVRSLVMAQALRQVGAGMACGLALCLALSATLARVIGAENAFPPLAYAGVPALMLLVAFLASWLPARAAARVQPTEALREG